MHELYVLSFYGNFELQIEIHTVQNIPHFTVMNIVSL
jgi:hypothetical protein